LLFTLAFFRVRHLATQFLTLSCPFFFILFCLDKDRFCSLAFFASWIFVLISFCCWQVIFIFTLSTELQMSLSLSFSDCECCERVPVNMSNVYE
jgi:hypothetical protein